MEWGVHWALNASRQFEGQVSILDLRSLVPLDTEAIYNLVTSHHRCLVVTEETIENSFTQTLAGRIGEHCFEYLDAPVKAIGAKNLPAIPLNSILEQEMVLNAEKVGIEIGKLLEY